MVGFWDSEWGDGADRGRGNGVFETEGESISAGLGVLGWLRD